MTVLRVFAAVVALIFAAPAAAATIPVTNTADSGAGSLRAAIAAAPASTPTTISLPAGTITLASPLTVTARSLTIAGAGAGVSAISGGGTTRIMDVTDASGVSFSGLTLEDGSDNTAAVVNAPAGATLTLDHADVRDNHSAVSADGDGDFLLTGGSLALSSGTIAGNVGGAGGHRVTGGIVNARNTAISVSGETITGNVAGGGGAAAATGGLFALTDTGAPNAPLTMNGVTATGNTAGGGGTASGVGLVDATDYDVAVTGSTFADNVIAGGGTADGFAVFTLSADAGRSTHITLTGSRVTGNQIGVGGETATGGAISASASDAGAALKVDVIDSLVSGNTVGGGGASGFGGAVETNTSGSGDTTAVAITGSTLSGNSVGAGFTGVGGAIAVSAVGAGTSTLTVDDSTLSGNAAGSSAAHDGYGGAIEVAGPVALSVSSSTLAGNRVEGPKGHGGGIYATAATLGSSIVAGNAASDHNNCFAAYTSLGHNLDGGHECGFSGAGDVQNTDPKLAPLGDYGGPLPTRALQVGSAAANAAGPCGGTDERGVARPQGPQCDIGAVEAALPAPSTLAPLVSPSAATLVGAIAALRDPVVAIFETGATTAYGTSLPATPLDPTIGPGLTVTGPITGLVRRTTYHARLDATTAAGTVDGADVAFTTPAPVATVSDFHVTPSTFRPAAVARGARKPKHAATGTSFRFTASDQGAASVAITHRATGRRSGSKCVKATHRLRHHKACTRTLADGSVHFRVAKAGRVDFPFSGRLGRRALGAGTYTATLTLLADAAPGRSRPVAARFVVRKR